MEIVPLIVRIAAKLGLPPRHDLDAYSADELQQLLDAFESDETIKPLIDTGNLRAMIDAGTPLSGMFEAVMAHGILRDTLSLAKIERDFPDLPRRKVLPLPVPPSTSLH